MRCLRDLNSAAATSTVLLLYSALVRGHYYEDLVRKGVRQFSSLEYNSVPINESADIIFTSQLDSLDGPHVSLINDTSFQWWYFSAFSNDLQSMIVINFFATTPNGFPATVNSPSVTNVNIRVRFSNGTDYELAIPAEAAELEWGGELGNGVVGHWKQPASSRFSGSPDLKRYSIKINAPEAGVVGYLNYESTAPAHYPCTSNLGAGHNLQIFPDVGWANAVPGAKANGEFSFGDSEMTFSNAIGYHDANWGNGPFATRLQSWYWGHANIGPYTIVWFDAIDAEGSEAVSAYVARDGKVLLASCELGSVTARPVGPAATYPPTIGHETFKYLHVRYALPSGKTFTANVNSSRLTLKVPPVYHRWIGHVTGGVDGEKIYDGVAEMEEFAFVP